MDGSRALASLYRRLAPKPTLLLHFSRATRCIAGVYRSRADRANINGWHEPAIYLLINLLKGTLTWFLLRSPPQDRCAMAETPPGEMIIRNFDYVFRLHRLPFGRSVCRPSARPSRRISRETPVIFYGFELLRQGRLILGLDARRKSHVMKQAVDIVLSPRRIDPTTLRPA